MKLLKSSFLLAAAATASLSDAAEFSLTYSPIPLSASGASATGRIGIDTSLIPNPGSYSDGNPISPTATPIVPPAWLTSFTLTVSGITGADSNLNGTYTLADLTHLGWSVSSAINFSNEIVGQPGFQYLSLALKDRINGLHSHGETYLYSDSHSVELELTSFIAWSGVSDIMAWMSSVNNAQRTYKAGYNLAVVALEGAHHRPLMSYDDMGKERATWVTGDFANSSRRRDVNVASGEVGTSWKAGSNGVFGVAAGYGSQREDLPLDGRNDVTGNYMFAEYDHKLSSGWIVSVLGMVGSWDAEILRGYLDAGLPDHSYGETGVTTRTARLRFDAPTLATVGGFGLSPFVSYSVTQTEVDAYTETGGAFPASYDAQKHQSEEGRLGLVASRDLTASTRLRLSAEAVHRFDGQGPALSGQDITGGVAFELDGSDPSPDCVRYGLDIDHKLTPTTMLSFSAFGSSTGEIPDVSGAISLRHAF